GKRHCRTRRCTVPVAALLDNLTERILGDDEDLDRHHHHHHHHRGQHPGYVTGRAYARPVRGVSLPGSHREQPSCPPRWAARLSLTADQLAGVTSNGRHLLPLPHGGIARSSAG